MPIVPNAPDRAHRIADLDGFWPLVWAAQDALGIPRYRGEFLAAPLPDDLLAKVLESATVVARQSPYAEAYAAADFPSPPVADDPAQTSLDWWRFLLCYATKIAARYQVSPTDIVFVAHCIAGGIETVLFGLPGTIRPAGVVLSGDPNLVNPRRVYVDLTTSVDPVADTQALLPEIRQAQRDVGFDADRHWSTPTGRPPSNTIWAYAELLYSDFGPLNHGRHLDWVTVTTILNSRFDFAYEPEDLERRVKEWRNRLPPAPPSSS